MAEGTVRMTAPLIYSFKKTVKSDSLSANNTTSIVEDSVSSAIRIKLHAVIHAVILALDWLKLPHIFEFCLSATLFIRSMLLGIFEGATHAS